MISKRAFIAVLTSVVLLLAGCVSLRSNDVSFVEVAASGPAPDLSVFPPDEPIFLEVVARPTLGFNFEYYLFIPPGSRSIESETRLLVEPNNTGTASDTHSDHAKSARRTIAYSRSRRMAEQLNTPLLVPVFDRPATGWERYTHALDSDTMGISRGQLARIDLQLIAMINNAKELLAKSGIETRRRVLMNGFSASGNFTNRFIALHPELVRAAAMGGVNGMPILPTTSAKGRELPFHVGVADVERLTGKSFDIRSYRLVSQFIYMGELDDNDTLPFDDAYNEDERELTLIVLGESMAERWSNSQSIINTLELPIIFATYGSIGHETTNVTEADVTRFLEANMGEAIRLPTPTGETAIGLREH